MTRRFVFFYHVLLKNIWISLICRQWLDEFVKKENIENLFFFSIIVLMQTIRKLYYILLFCRCFSNVYCVVIIINRILCVMLQRLRAESDVINSDLKWEAQLKKMFNKSFMLSLFSHLNYTLNKLFVIKN